MNQYYYVRYFNEEYILNSPEELKTFLLSHSLLEDDSAFDERICHIRKGINKIMLDRSNKTYAIVIRTGKSTLEEFKGYIRISRVQDGGESAKSESVSNISEPDKVLEGWKEYAMDYIRIESEPTAYTFKARIRNATAKTAYTQMCNYLISIHGEEKCAFSEFSVGIIRISDIAE